VYDLVILGGGPGGYVAAIRACQLGMKTALIEKDRLGGTCLNRGCIPTKAYYKNAELLRSLAKLQEFSIQMGNALPSFDLRGAKERKDRIVNNLVSGVETLLKGNGVEIIKGEGQLDRPGLVTVGDRELVARNILIATGSQAVFPPVSGLEEAGILDSSSVLELEQVPSRLAIIGGGVIGMELAGIFNAFGSQVTVLEAAPAVLSGMDAELVKRFTVLLKKQGIELLTSVQIEKVEKEVTGYMLYGKSPKGEIIRRADQVLVAAGRKAVVDGINLKMDLDDKGFIKAAADFSTSVPGVYAIGDVIGGYMLAHVASAEGMAAVENMKGINSRVDYSAIPNCIFTFPEIASVGLTEEQARAAGIKYQKGKSLFASNGKALGMGETDGFIKVIADEEDRIIGVHILGAHASDLILEASLMVKEKLTAQQVIRTVHPHPTLGEVLQEAVMDIKGRAIHQLKGK